MERLLYEHSVASHGYLIIPVVVGQVGEETLYSFKLLSELGHHGQFHQQENPSGICETAITSTIAIAQDFLSHHSDIANPSNYFQHRYTYRHNLIVAIEQAGKWFYDHYPPTELRNIAAPKLFSSQAECLTWIRQGLTSNSAINER